MEFPDRARPPRPNDSARRYGSADDSGYPASYPYTASDVYDTNVGERWPANVSRVPRPAPEEDEEPPVRRDYWAVLLWTLGWYALPAAIVLVRAVLLPTTGDPTRASALEEVLVNTPLWLLALGCALVLAVVLRWAGDAWRAVTIGFCAAVVSGGAITVLHRIW